ncbi:MAG: tetratricopeptide repeat protein [Terriglobales bacterium]
MKRRFAVIFLITLSAIAAVAQEPPSDTKHGILVRVAQIYISPDTSSAKLGEATRGREVFELDRSREWLHVTASLGPEKTVTGWIADRGVIRINTPDGDKILFGEAAASELEASKRHGRKGAADDARRLYYRVFDYFPNSTLAGEGLYRAADILWQMDSHTRGRSESTMSDPNNPADAAEDYMKLVIKKFPRTKVADMAAFHLIDTKLCEDWAGQSKCPDKEAEVYEKYAAEHPDSPNAAEALYNAARRRAALIETYKTENKPKQSDESRARAKADGDLAVSKYPQSDWAYRARTLLYMIDQGIPTYGNAQE